MFFQSKSNFFLLSILILLISFSSSHASINELLETVPEIKKRITHDTVDWNELIEQAKLNGNKVYLVDSLKDLKEKSENAQPGDVIQIKNGTYMAWELRIKTSGTAEKPIIYTAETPGGVTFYHNARIRILGDHNIVGGFVFENVKTGNIIDFIGASHNRFTDNEFYNCGKKAKARILSLKDGSHHNRIDNNLMDNNQAFGMVVFLSDDVDVSQHNRFDHNTFQNIHSDSIFEKVSIQIGQYGSKRYKYFNTYTLVDNNRFLDVKNNNINSKSNYEYFIDNFFLNTPSLIALSLRAGDHKYVEGNYFANVHSAIRAFGLHHVITNNVIINSYESGISIPSWGWVAKPKTSVMSYYRETGDIIVSNNFIHSQLASIEIGRKWGYPKLGLQVADNPPERTKIMNNILIGDSEKLYDMRASIDLEFEGNHTVR